MKFETHRFSGALLALALGIFAAGSASAASSVLIDISASGESDYVRGYGAYIEVNYTAARAVESIDYCDNIPPGGTGPDTSRTRRGDSGFWCVNYSLDELQEGRSMIRLGGIDFLSISAPGLEPNSGGQLNIKFAKSVGLMGVQRRIMRVRVSRPSGAADFQASLVSRRGVERFDWMSIDVSTSLGYPTGVDAVRLWLGNSRLPALDLDRDLDRA